MIKSAEAQIIRAELYFYQMFDIRMRKALESF